MVRPARWRPSRLLGAWVALGLAVVGAALVWAALARPATPEAAIEAAPSQISPSATPPQAPQPTPKRPSKRVPHRDLRDRIDGSVLPESDPVAVSISRIGVRSTLVELGIDAAGAMEVPQDPALAGWFSQGAAPGALGPAIIAGHVTWDGAPAVFHRLGTVRRGDEVTVTRKDGNTAIFTVTRVARFAKSESPSRAVYGAIDHAGLRLITCGGTYDAARHRYLDNVVVFAKLTTHSPRG